MNMNENNKEEKLLQLRQIMDEASPEEVSDFFAKLNHIESLMDERLNRVALERQHQQRQRELQSQDFITTILNLILPFINLIDTQGCDFVNAQFPDGQVLCECTGGVLTGLNFVCPWFEPLCLDSNDNFCARPVYSGTLSLLLTTIQNRVAMSNVTIFGLPVGDLSIEVTLNPMNNRILNCEASFLGLACLSCSPCPGGGITLQCGVDPKTECFDLGGNVTRVSDPDNVVTGFTAFGIFGDLLGLTGKEKEGIPDGDDGDE